MFHGPTNEIYVDFLKFWPLLPLCLHFELIKHIYSAYQLNAGFGRYGDGIQISERTGDFYKKSAKMTGLKNGPLPGESESELNFWYSKPSLGPSF